MTIAQNIKTADIFIYISKNMHFSLLMVSRKEIRKDAYFQEFIMLSSSPFLFNNKCTYLDRKGCYSSSVIIQHIIGPHIALVLE